MPDKLTLVFVTVTSLLINEFKKYRPKSVVVKKTIENELIIQNQYGAYYEICATLGSSMMSIHKILHKLLSMKKIYAHWIAHNLTIVRSHPSCLCVFNLYLKFLYIPLKWFYPINQRCLINFLKSFTIYHYSFVMRIWKVTFINICCLIFVIN